MALCALAAGRRFIAAQTLPRARTLRHKAPKVRKIYPANRSVRNLNLDLARGYNFRRRAYLNPPSSLIFRAEFRRLEI